MSPRIGTTSLISALAYAAGVTFPNVECGRNFTHSGGGPLPLGAKAVAVGLEVEDVTMVQQSVDQRAGKNGVSENASPLGRVGGPSVKR